MKTMSAMEARQQFGSLLNLVSLTHEQVIIERAGKKIAVVSEYQPSPPVAPPSGKADIRGLEGLGADIWQGQDTDEYLRQARKQWD